LSRLGFWGSQLGGDAMSSEFGFTEPSSIQKNGSITSSSSTVNRMYSHHRVFGLANISPSPS